MAAAEEIIRVGLHTSPEKLAAIIDEHFFRATQSGMIDISYNGVLFSSGNVFLEKTWFEVGGIEDQLSLKMIINKLKLMLRPTNEDASDATPTPESGASRDSSKA